MTWLLAFIASAALVGTIACNKTESPTSPTNTTPVTTIAEPTVTEEFAGTVTVGGFSFYSFTVEQNGTVQITLANVGGTNVPSTVWLGLGIGTPAGEDCATTSALNTQAATSAQLTGTYAPGIYCARVHDIGNLVAPATFSVSIAHP
jgi:hypothetical protein